MRLRSGNNRNFMYLHTFQSLGFNVSALYVIALFDAFEIFEHSTLID